MRLVTYDRGGHRRLGAILEAEVIDLPDAVGHPAFPTTLEGLVSSSRGTVMDAARAALQRDDAWNWRVPKPRVLTPLFPQSLLSPRAMDVDRRIVGPEQAVPWPDWRAHASDGAPVEHADGVPIAIGPCVVTTDELDPQTMFVTVKVDDQDLLKGNLNGAAASLFRLIADVSQHAVLERGDAFALGPFPPVEDDADPSRRLWPGAQVELAAEGIGTLRNRVDAR
jgi:hypothetical protein